MGDARGGSPRDLRTGNATRGTGSLRRAIRRHGGNLDPADPQDRRCPRHLGEPALAASWPGGRTTLRSSEGCWRISELRWRTVTSAFSQRWPARNAGVTQISSKQTTIGMGAAATEVSPGAVRANETVMSRTLMTTAGDRPATSCWLRRQPRMLTCDVLLLDDDDVRRPESTCLRLKPFLLPQANGRQADHRNPRRGDEVAASSVGRNASALRSSTGAAPDARNGGICA